ncbi:unnamed protein product [Cyprideis torosa]|uniref:Uncharacterized protein n=1 Tax=Cyprideis torosa TaxID=163714 RepID=A0A7R8WAX9_9CRUS|nr:unnamed protein product [Cyprideis torosa]CAG0891556.1 unnamed protein product [Cyprideis torosa]
MSLKILAAFLFLGSAAAQQPCALLWVPGDSCVGEPDIVAHAGPDNYIPDLGSMNDEITMIQVLGQCYITIFDDSGYQGGCTTLFGGSWGTCYNLKDFSGPGNCAGHPTRYGDRRQVQPYGNDVHRWNDDMNSFKCDCVAA